MYTISKPDQFKKYAETVDVVVYNSRGRCRSMPYHKMCRKRFPRETIQQCLNGFMMSMSRLGNCMRDQLSFRQLL